MLGTHICCWFINLALIISCRCKIHMLLVYILEAIGIDIRKISYSYLRDFDVFRFEAFLGCIGNYPLWTLNQYISADDGVSDQESYSYTYSYWDNLLDCSRFVSSLTFLPFQKQSHLAMHIQDPLRVLAENGMLTQETLVKFMHFSYYKP